MPRPKTANDMFKVLHTKVINYEVRDILAELEQARAKDAVVAASGFSTNPAPRPSTSSSRHVSQLGSLRLHARRRSVYAPVVELPDEEAEATEGESLIRSASLDIESPAGSIGANTMSRTTRPTHIPLPTNSPFGRSPNGSPLPTPGAPLASPTSPRSSFLPSFMRTRSRAATLTGNRGRASPSFEAANPLGGSVSGTRSRTSGELAAIRDGTTVTRSVSTPQTTNLNAASVSANGPSTIPEVTATDDATSALHSLSSSSPSKTFRIRLVPHLESTRSLAFDPVIRELHPISVPAGVAPPDAAAAVTNLAPSVNGRPPALLLRIGRFTDKTPALPNPTTASGSAGTSAGPSTGSMIGEGPMSNPIAIAGGGGDICSNKVAFRSKVVSRAHAEIWCEAGGKFFIRDTSSSSGTFLNHIRLSSPNTESRSTQINDGDILQLGVDYQGGHEDMFRCVKMRVELGREWQRGRNEFNTNALKQLKALGGATPESKGKSAALATPSSTKKGKASVTDCCICLFSVTVCQSLFIAPCSHVFHYKCIRPLLMQHHPGFSCPLCRTFANLEEDVETEDAWELASRRASVLSRRTSNHSVQLQSSDNLRDLPVTGPFGQPTTSIPMADGSVDVEHYLNPEHIANGHGDSHAPVMLGSAPLDRQHTAVQGDDGSATGVGDMQVPEMVHEENELVASTDTHLDSAPSTAFLQTPNDPFRSAEETAAIPINSNNPFLSSFSQVGTPLSTVAPGMLQRLELAEAIDSSSSTGHGSASGSGGGDRDPEAIPEVDEMNGDMMEMELDEQRMRTEEGMEEGLVARQKRGMEARREEVQDMAFD